MFANFDFIYQERLMKIEQQRSEKEMKQQAIENVCFSYVVSNQVFGINKIAR